MAIQVQSVQQINAASEKSTFTLEELPWDKGVDRTKQFGPDSMLHLTYCPSYAQLNPEEKLYYNQVHSMGICEEFTVLEELQFVRGLGHLLTSSTFKMDAAMREAIHTFIEEEKKHSAMFKRLLVAAAPEVYQSVEQAEQNFRICALSPMDRRAVYFVLDRPEFFMGWVWSALLFEEKTLEFYRKYNTCPDSANVDPLFHAVHKYHAMDEIRHVHLDHHFVDMLWEPASRFKRWWNAQLVVMGLRSFVYPKRTAKRAIQLLVQKFPRLASLEPVLQAEMRAVSKNPVWHEAFYSRKTMPRTFALFDRFPELAGLSGVFQCYRPQ